MFIQNSGRETGDLCESHLLQIDLYEEVKNSKDFPKYFLDTKLPKLRGVKLSNVDWFYQETAFEVGIQRFLKEVFPSEVELLILTSKNKNFVPNLDVKNVRTLCELLNKRRIKNHLQLEGFKLTVPLFNEIIKNCWKLETVIIKNNHFKNSNFGLENSTEDEIDLSPLLRAEKLKTLQIFNEGLSEEEEELLRIQKEAIAKKRATLNMEAEEKNEEEDENNEEEE